MNDEMAGTTWLGDLLDLGTRLFQEEETHKALEKSVLDEFRMKAEIRAAALVRKVFNLSESEFDALNPIFCDSDYGYSVVFRAYNSELWAEIVHFDYTASNADDDEYKIRIVKVNGVYRHWSQEKIPVTRDTLALWLVRARADFHAETIRTVNEISAFRPFKYYRVWYGQYDDGQYVDVRYLPAIANDPLIAVDGTRVWIPVPVRIVEMNVSCVDDLPEWCERVNGVRVVPEWALSMAEEV